MANQCSEGMFQRQIVQAYTPILTLSAFPPSYNDIINAPEMTSVHRTTSAPEAEDFSKERVRIEEEEAHASGEQNGREHTWKSETRK